MQRLLSKHRRPAVRSALFLRFCMYAMNTFTQLIERPWRLITTNKACQAVTSAYVNHDVRYVQVHQLSAQALCEEVVFWPARNRRYEANALGITRPAYLTNQRLWLNSGLGNVLPNITTFYYSAWATTSQAQALRHIRPRLPPGFESTKDGLRP